MQDELASLTFLDPACGSGNFLTETYIGLRHPENRILAAHTASTLADLYDELTMPPDLRRAHQETDRAVMSAYGFSTKMTESECVAALFERYKTLAQSHRPQGALRVP